MFILNIASGREKVPSSVDLDQLPAHCFKAFCCRDYQQIARVSAALEAGMVGINDVAVSTPEAPFGGYKTSGIGKEGSRHGMDEYSNIKLISLGGL